MFPKQVLIFLFFVVPAFSDRSFKIDYERDCFSKDGTCYRYIAGEMHYFRIPQEYWKDRLMKMKAAGFTTVQTYIAWNVHQPTEDYSPLLDPMDVCRFIELAQEEGLTVIIRPGPYLDAEWDFGGFPAWLLKDRPNMGMELRSNATDFMTEIKRWYGILLPKMIPYLYANGGPIIAVQVENEAGGSPPCDAAHFDYLEKLRDIYKEHLGEKVVYLTVDGDRAKLGKCGNIKGLYSTLNFGASGRASKKFAVQRIAEPNGPYVCSAFFSGWLDHWGFPFNKVSTESLVAGLKDVLEFSDRGASVSMYMFHGGTNFAWGQGARSDIDKTMNNTYTRLWGKMTSYDYDAPLSEAGDITPKYLAIRELLSHYSSILPIPTNTTKQRGGLVPMFRRLDIFDLVYLAKWRTLGGFVKSKYPLPMEQMGQFHGPVAYQVSIPETVSLPAAIEVPLYGDRIYLITLNENKRVHVQINSRNRAAKTFRVFQRNLLFLVDENGHSNSNNVRYGNIMYQKGILSNVTANGVVLTGWTAALIGKVMIPDIMNQSQQKVPSVLDKTKARSASRYTGDFLPAVYVGQVGYPVYHEFNDTFIDTQGWGKGIIWLDSSFDNDYSAFNLGRYWPLAGPQKRSFCPGPWMQKTGRINLFEFEREPATTAVSLEDTPLVDGDYDGTQL